MASGRDVVLVVGLSKEFGEMEKELPGETLPVPASVWVRSAIMHVVRCFLDLDDPQGGVMRVLVPDPSGSGWVVLLSSADTVLETQTRLFSWDLSQNALPSPGLDRLRASTQSLPAVGPSVSSRHVVWLTDTTIPSSENLLEDIQPGTLITSWDAVTLSGQMGSPDPSDPASAAKWAASLSSLRLQLQRILMSRLRWMEIRVQDLPSRIAPPGGRAGSTTLNVLCRASDTVSIPPVSNSHVLDVAVSWRRVDPARERPLQWASSELLPATFVASHDTVTQSVLAELGSGNVVVMGVVAAGGVSRTTSGGWRQEWMLIQHTTGALFVHSLPLCHAATRTSFEDGAGGLRQVLGPPGGRSAGWSRWAVERADVSLRMQTRAAQVPLTDLRLTSFAKLVRYNLLRPPSWGGQAPAMGPQITKTTTTTTTEMKNKKRTRRSRAQGLTFATLMRGREGPKDGVAQEEQVVGCGDRLGRRAPLRLARATRDFPLRHSFTTALGLPKGEPTGDARSCRRGALLEEWVTSVKGSSGGVVVGEPASLMEAAVATQQEVLPRSTKAPEGMTRTRTGRLVKSVAYANLAGNGSSGSDEEGGAKEGRVGRKGGPEREGDVEWRAEEEEGPPGDDEEEEEEYLEQELEGKLGAKLQGRKRRDKQRRRNSRANTTNAPGGAKPKDNVSVFTPPLRPWGELQMVVAPNMEALWWRLVRLGWEEDVMPSPSMPQVIVPPSGKVPDQRMHARPATQSVRVTGGIDRVMELVRRIWICLQPHLPPRPVTLFNHAPFFDGRMRAIASELAVAQSSFPHGEEALALWAEVLHRIRRASVWSPSHAAIWDGTRVMDTNGVVRWNNFTFPTYEASGRRAGLPKDSSGKSLELGSAVLVSEGAGGDDVLEAADRPRSDADRPTGANPSGPPLGPPVPSVPWSDQFSPAVALGVGTAAVGGEQRRPDADGNPLVGNWWAPKPRGEKRGRPGGSAGPDPPMKRPRVVVRYEGAQ